MRQMAEAPKKPSSGGQQSSPLVIIVAIVVFLVLLFGIYKLTLGRDKPAEPANNTTSVTANTPTKAEAPPKPEKREPQVGDVVYSIDLDAPSKKPNEWHHPFGHLEIGLVRYDKSNNSWMGRARLTYFNTREADVVMYAVLRPSTRTRNEEWCYFISFKVPCWSEDCKAWHAGTIELAPLIYLNREIEVSAVPDVDVSYQPRE